MGFLSGNEVFAARDGASTTEQAQHPRTQLFLLLAAIAATRFVFRSRYLYDIDSVNFALALARFDPSVHQPHPPGYFLYVLLGRLVNAVVREPNTALVAISIAASCGAGAMIVLLTRQWFGPDSARFAGWLFLFSPLAWFHGTVALTYMVEMFFSALLGWLCWNRFVWSGALALGVAAGFRPSSLLFLGPMYMFSLRGSARWRQISCLAVLAATLLAWMIPMLIASGGSRIWWASLAALWTTVAGKETVANSSVATSVARLATIGFILLLAFGVAAFGFLNSARHRSQEEALPDFKDPPGLLRFAAIWILPGLLFFTFVFLKLVNGGYLLVILPPVFAWLASLVSAWYRRRRAMWLAVGAAANTAIFLFAPVYCSWTSVRKFERNLESVLACWPRQASPADTLIVGFDSHFLGYRHAGYYLPEYVTVQYPRVRVAAGPRVFVMQNRDTWLAPEVDTRRFQRLILFPLPDGESAYAAYMREIEAKFVPGDLQKAGCATRPFAIAPISALPVLFPEARPLEVHH